MHSNSRSDLYAIHPILNLIGKVRYLEVSYRISQKCAVHIAHNQTSNAFHPK